MAVDAKLLVDGRVVDQAISSTSIATAIQTADEFVRVERGRSSVDVASVDGRYALVSSSTDKRVAPSTERFVTFDEAVAALVDYATADMPTTPAPDGRTRRSTATAASRRPDRETRVFRSVVLPLLLVVAGAVIAMIGARTEQSSGAGEPHPAALIGGLFCFLVFLAVMMMFTMPYVKHRLELRFDVEITSDSLFEAWRVADDGRHGAKFVISLISLALLLSILLTPLVIVIGAVALR